MDTIRAMLEEHKLIVICRGVYGDTLLKTMEALYKGGIRLAEVTFDQKSKDYKETLDAITSWRSIFEAVWRSGQGRLSVLHRWSLRIRQRLPISFHRMSMKRSFVKQRSWACCPFREH